MRKKTFLANRLMFWFSWLMLISALSVTSVIMLIIYLAGRYIEKPITWVEISIILFVLLVCALLSLYNSSLIIFEEHTFSYKTKCYKKAKRRFEYNYVNKINVCIEYHPQELSGAERKQYFKKVIYFYHEKELILRVAISYPLLREILKRFPKEIIAVKYYKKINSLSKSLRELLWECFSEEQKNMILKGNSSDLSEKNEKARNGVTKIKLKKENINDYVNDEAFKANCQLLVSHEKSVFKDIVSRFESEKKKLEDVGLAFDIYLQWQYRNSSEENYQQRIDFKDGYVCLIRMQIRKKDDPEFVSNNPTIQFGVLFTYILKKSLKIEFGRYPLEDLYTMLTFLNVKEIIAQILTKGYDKVLKGLIKEGKNVFII